MAIKYSGSRRNSSKKRYYMPLTPPPILHQPTSQTAIRTAHSRTIAQMFKCADALSKYDDPVYGMQVEAEIKRARGLGKRDLLMDRF